MVELSEAYYTFWSQFCDAYPEGAVPTSVPDPDDPENEEKNIPTPYPYLVFDTPMSTYSQNTPHKAILYVQAQSMIEVWKICDKIQAGLPEQGVTILLDNNKGAVTIYRGDSAFIQNYDLTEVEKEQYIKAAYLNMYVRCNMI